METKQEASVAELVNSVITDGQALVKQQIELAKSELSYSAKQAAATSGMLIGAGVLGFLAFVFLLVAGAYGIVAAGLPVWAGFLIVAGVLLLVAAILGLLGRSRSKQVGPPRWTCAAMPDPTTPRAGTTPSRSRPT
jgi:Flp pilus assembly protein TadB